MEYFKTVGSKHEIRMALFDQVDCANRHLTSEQGKEASPEDVQATLKEIGLKTIFAQNAQECYLFALESEKAILEQECSEPRKVSLKDFKYEQDKLQPTDLVVTTKGLYKRYGEEVLGRIEASVHTLLKVLSDTIECYEPPEGSPDSVIFTLPVVAWSKFYQGHTQVEQGLIRIERAITEEKSQQ